MQLLDGFGIGGYRSFGKLQRIGPLSKVNIFVGQNNAGKSNILKFLSTQLQLAFKVLKGATQRGSAIESMKLTHEETHHSAKPISFALSLCVDRKRAEEFLSRIVEPAPHNILNRFKRIQSQLFPSGDPLWLDYVIDHEEKLSLSREIAADIRRRSTVPVHFWTEFSDALRLNTNDQQTAIDNTLKKLAHAVFAAPPRNATMIPAIRKITSADEELTFSGDGLILALTRLRDPELQN